MPIFQNSLLFKEKNCLYVKKNITSVANGLVILSMFAPVAEMAVPIQIRSSKKSSKVHLLKLLLSFLPTLSQGVVIKFFEERSSQYL